MDTPMTRDEYLAEVAESPFWRPCHTPGCPNKFEPEKGGQYHCSDACAAACLASRSA